MVFDEPVQCVASKRETYYRIVEAITLASRNPLYGILWYGDGPRKVIGNLFQDATASYNESPDGDSFVIAVDNQFLSGRATLSPGSDQVKITVYNKHKSLMYIVGHDQLCKNVHNVPKAMEYLFQTVVTDAINGNYSKAQTPMSAESKKSLSNSDPTQPSLIGIVLAVLLGLGLFVVAPQACSSSSCSSHSSSRSAKELSTEEKAELLNWYDEKDSKGNYKNRD